MICEIVEENKLASFASSNSWYYEFISEVSFLDIKNNSNAKDISE
jgi:hypothetical protein